MTYFRLPFEKKYQIAGFGTNLGRKQNVRIVCEKVQNETKTTFHYELLFTAF